MTDTAQTTLLDSLSDALADLSESTGQSPQDLLRFWVKVDASGDCWEWLAGRTHDGYGQFHVGKKKVYAHRFAYETLVGIVPSGRELDHLCRNRACVNPEHLEPVTQSENARRGRHPFTLRRHMTRGNHRGLLRPPGPHPGPRQHPTL
jgi:hypothetical protein